MYQSHAILQDSDENTELKLGQEIGAVECCQYSYFLSLLTLFFYSSMSALPIIVSQKSPSVGVFTH